ncbi:MAG: DUF177 domain-containing protein [Candidatus Nitrohelix vancouverensis]|uniref:DUF177 domain-containing protein n=1 Tax=Candidatus Nitrohelix vancouverensis TaxID=2705534 RepID=A0A7T0C3J7_9BACT|nr:MAG: DUF177 domain-containing protein [Candidatus Nitrohelix vancouverensis]
MERHPLLFNVDEISEDGVKIDLLGNRELFKINDDDCSLTQDVSLQGDIRKIYEELYFKGVFETQAKLLCCRCLGPVVRSLKGEAYCKFVPKGLEPELGAEMEIDPAGIDVEYFDGNTVDLILTVRDAILLAAPSAITCGEQCRGLCSQCGVNLNKKTCDCQTGIEVDPRFEILKSLKFKNK